MGKNGCKEEGRQGDSGKLVVLTNGITHWRNDVFVVLQNTVIVPTKEKQAIKVTTRKHQDKLYFRRGGIHEANIIEGNGGIKSEKQKHSF